MATFGFVWSLKCTIDWELIVFVGNSLWVMWHSRFALYDSNGAHIDTPGKSKHAASIRLSSWKPILLQAVVGKHLSPNYTQFPMINTFNWTWLAKFTVNFNSFFIVLCGALKIHLDFLAFIFVCTMNKIKIIRGHATWTSLSQNVDNIFTISFVCVCWFFLFLCTLSFVSAAVGEFIWITELLSEWNCDLVTDDGLGARSGSHGIYLLDLECAQTFN